MGEVEESIIKQSANNNQPLPERILNKPQLHKGLTLFLEAFYELSSDRQTGLGVGYIPFTAIKSYADEYGFEGEQREDLFYFVREIDKAIVKLLKSSKPDGERSKRPSGKTR